MDKLPKDRVVKSVVGVIVSLILFFSSGVHVPGLDSTAESYFKDSITKAGVSYGVCRVINGTVSVIQQSSLQLEPAGVGLSLAVGQIVDPINDMVERLSDVLVLAITSLGVQEIMHEMGIVLAPPVLGILLLLSSVLLWQKGERYHSLQIVLRNLIIILVIGRCCLAFSSLTNGFLQEHFFEEKIVEANGRLSDSTIELSTVDDLEDLPEYDGMFKTIESSARYLKNKSVDFKNTVAVVLENKATIVDSLLSLTFLYLGVFIIQVLFLPLFIFWVMVKTVNALFNQRS